MTVRLDEAAIIERVRSAAMRGVYKGVSLVRNEAISLILDTPKTGRIYRRGDEEHQASAPGEAPASDTGTLVGRIRVDRSREAELIGIVRASTDYAKALEYGTPRMEPRPFMRPALANKKQEIEAVIDREVSRALRRRGE